MHHAFIDSYADLGTPLHRMDARTKLLCALCLLLAIVLTPASYVVILCAYGVIIGILIMISKIPLKFISRRFIELLPFVIVVSLSALLRKNGFTPFAVYTGKAAMAVIVMLLVSSTTRFTELMQALARLGIPSLFIDLFSFMYRYSFLLEDQFLRSRRALQSRSAGRGGSVRTLSVLSNIVGTIFIRSYERAERVYLAMCARGYTYEKSN